MTKMNSSNAGLKRYWCSLSLLRLIALLLLFLLGALLVPSQAEDREGQNYGGAPECPDAHPVSGADDIVEARRRRCPDGSCCC
jgi:hypothetical protein